MTTINPKALEAAALVLCNYAASRHASRSWEPFTEKQWAYLKEKDPKYVAGHVQVAKEILTAYLAALPAGDEAEAVKELRDSAEDLGGYEDAVMREAADIIDRQSATIAQLRGEVDKIKSSLACGMKWLEQFDRAKTVEQKAHIMASALEHFVLAADEGKRNG